MRATLLRVDSEAALEVCVHREVHRGDDSAKMHQHLTESAPLSARPRVHAEPALVVASALKPNCSKARRPPRPKGSA